MYVSIWLSVEAVTCQCVMTNEAGQVLLNSWLCSFAPVLHPLACSPMVCAWKGEGYTYRCTETFIYASLTASA